MTALKTLQRTRRRLYRAASILGDVNAIASGHPVSRAVRKQAWRSTSRLLRRWLP